MTLFEKMNFLGRQCFHCGSFFSGKSLFCRSCEKRLWDRHQDRHISQLEDFKMICLFEWIPDEDRQVSKLLATLKGGRIPSAFYFYAKEFISRKKPILPDGDIVLIPCPGKRPDHASVLTSVFAEILALPSDDCLEKEKNQIAQKKKNRKQRANLRFFCHSAMAKKHVIFIDDIVTSGATIRAARKAIGPCQSFQVWSLARRVVSLRDPC